MRGGREDRACTEVVSTILIGRLCRLDRFCRRADDLVRVEQFSADRDRQIARTDVNACGIARNRNVYTVVNDERDLKAVRTALTCCASSRYARPPVSFSRS